MQRNGSGDGPSGPMLHNLCQARPGMGMSPGLDWGMDLQQLAALVVGGFAKVIRSNSEDMTGMLFFVFDSLSLSL